MTIISDPEDLIVLLVDYLKNNLSTEILAMNSRKPDEYTIEDFPQDDTHFLLHADLYDIPNNDFVQVYIEPISEDGQDHTRVLRIPAIIRICIHNDFGTGAYRKSLRYLYCLDQLIRKFEYLYTNLADIQITEIFPYATDTESYRIWVTGLRLITSLA